MMLAVYRYVAVGFTDISVYVWYSLTGEAFLLMYTCFIYRIE